MKWQIFWNDNDNNRKHLIGMDQGRFQKDKFWLDGMSFILTKGKIWFDIKKDDGTLKINRLPKRQSIKVTIVDPLTGKWQISVLS